MCCWRLAGNAGRKNDAKNRHLCTIAHVCRAISSQLKHVSTIGEKNLSSNISSTCPYNMVNFGLLAAEIISLVWGTQLISTGFASWQRYCIATLRRWTDGATCIRQGGHHVGHWPTFLVSYKSDVRMYPFFSAILCFQFISISCGIGLRQSKYCVLLYGFLSYLLTAANYFMLRCS